MRAAAATGLDAEVATAAHGAVLAAARAAPCPPIASRVRRSLDYSVPDDMARWVQPDADGQLFCRICKKRATQEHLRSPTHAKRIEEDAILNAYTGRAGTTRRFAGKLCTGRPTQQKIMQFWGDAVPHLPWVAMHVHKLKVAFYVNSSHDRPIYAHDANYELGIVAYRGSGKYEGCTYLPWHALPVSDSDGDAPFGCPDAGDGKGWWPVVCVQKTADTAMLVCIYQLTAEGDVPAWPIRLPTEV